MLSLVDRSRWIFVAIAGFAVGACNSASPSGWDDVVTSDVGVDVTVVDVGTDVRHDVGVPDLGHDAGLPDLGHDTGHDTGVATDTGVPTDTGGGTMCVTSCTTNAECQASCPNPGTTAIACCNFNVCSYARGSVCGVTPPDSGTTPPDASTSCAGFTCTVDSDCSSMCAGSTCSGGSCL